MFHPKTPASILDAGNLEEVGPRTYEGALARYAFLRIGGKVYAPVVATRRVDGYLSEPGINKVKISTWAGPHFVVAFLRPDGSPVEDLPEVLKRCHQWRLGRLLMTLGAAIFPGLLLTPAGTAAIAAYGIYRFWRRGREIGELGSTGI